MATVLDKTPKLFGALIVSVNTTLSWGSQGASTQFTVVEDPNNKDEDGNDAPITINIPPMGTPILFPNYQTELVTNPDYDEVDNPNVPIVIEEFALDNNGNKIPQTFGPFSPDKPLASGFLQRATYSESLSGRTYDIVIQSPATILDGVQVVLKEFNGTGLGGTLTNEVINLMNVFGHYENFLVGGNNPFTAAWYNGVARGGFAGSGSDDLGFPLLSTNQRGQTVNFFDTLVQMTYDPYYSAFGNPIRHGNYAYELDLTELYDAINSRNLWYYRISGDVRDLGSIISELCEILQADWMVELRLPNANSITGNLRLYLRLIDRSSPPTAGVVKQFIANTYDEGNAAYGSLVSCSYGQELSSATTAKVVLGAPVSRYVDQSIDDCVPMFGRGSGEGNWQMGPKWSDNPAAGPLYNPNKAGKYMRVNEFYTRENLVDPNFWFTVNIPGYGDYKVTLMELRMLTGKEPRRSWSHFKAFQTMAGKEPNRGTPATMYSQPWYSDVKITQNDMTAIMYGWTKILSLQQTQIKENAKRAQASKRKEFNVFFEGLSQIANSFCKQFMARVPNDLEDETYGLDSQQIIQENIKFINTYGDLEAEQYQTAWSIASDAWALDPQVGRPDFFNNGRLKPMVGFKKTIQAGDWGDAYGFQWSDTYAGGPLVSNAPDKGVNVRDMGDSWTYSRVFSQQQTNPNMVPWDAFHGGGPSPMRMPQFNPQTGKFQQAVYNPWGRGIGQNTMLGVSANILSLDGGPLEEQIYFIPESEPPTKDGAAAWVPCEAGSNPIITDEMTTQQGGLSVLWKYFFGPIGPLPGGPQFYQWLHPNSYGASADIRDVAVGGSLVPNPAFNPNIAGCLQGCANAQLIPVSFMTNYQTYKRKKFDHLYFEVPPLRALPIGFGIPQQSNKYRYGPWIKVNAPNVTIPNPRYDSTDPDSPETILSYVAGKTAVEFDDSLSPETFGGYGGMNQAGFTATEIDIGRVAVDETGYVELVGVPKYNLGERFENAGPYVTDLDVSVGTDGVTHTYKFNTWTPQRGKLAKYNIGILQRVGKSSFKNLLGAQNTASRMPIAGGIDVFGVDPRLARIDTFKNSTFSFNPSESGDINPPHMITAQYWKAADTTTVGTINLQSSASSSTASSSTASTNTSSSSSSVAADTSDEDTIVASTDTTSSTSSYS